MHSSFKGGDEDDDTKKNNDKPVSAGAEAGDYNELLGDEMGTRIGEGHDTIEDGVGG